MECWKVANFINGVRKKIKFLLIRHVNTSNFADVSRKMRISPIGHGKIANFVRQTRKDFEFCPSDVKNCTCRWSGKKTSQVLLTMLEKLKIWFIGCGKIAFFDCLTSEKNTNFVANSRKNCKFHQSRSEKSRSLSIIRSNNVTFVDRLHKNCEFHNHVRKLRAFCR